MWIAEIDAGDVGLLQSYRHVDYPDHDASVAIADAVGIDYLITGRYRGRGYGRQVLCSFAAWSLTQYPEATRCVATPVQANEASWRALEHAGFVRVGDCQPPDEPPAFIYTLERSGER